MYKLHKRASCGDGLRSIPTMPHEESTWRPSLRKMTKGMFSSSRKSPTRPARPTLPQGWMNENEVTSPSPNDPPHTTISQHPRGVKEIPPEKLGFIKRSMSKRDKDQPPPRQQTHVSKPSIGASSFSAISTQYTQLTQDIRYTDTDAETSPSSTIPRDFPTPTGYRKSYASKRSGNDYTNSSILLPTVYQPPASEVIDVSLDIFPAPPLEIYPSSATLNPRVSSPIIFPPARTIHTATEGKEGPQGLQRLSIAEHPETLKILSEPRLEIKDAQKSSEELNDDFQIFLAKSRTQAKNRNSMFSQHNFKPDPQPQDIYSTPRTSKVLDEITLNRKIKRLSQTGSLSNATSAPKPRTFSTQVEPRAALGSQPEEKLETTAALHPDLLVISPNDVTKETTKPAKQTPSGTPLHESRFSVDSRPHHSSMNYSLYGKLRGYIFPSRSRPTSTTPNSALVNNGYAPQIPRLHKDKSYGAFKGGTPVAGTTSCGRWSRMGRSIKRSLSVDRDKENDARVFSGRKGAEFLSDREDLRGVGLEGGQAGKRGSKIMPTSRGLDRYNRTVNGGYWK